MTTQLDELMEKLREVQAEIEVELAKRREELRFRIENRRIVFEKEVLRLHREIKTRVSRYLIDANPLVILTAPMIYSLIVPIALLDLCVMAYQAICFPIYKIPKVRRRDYLVLDRHHLAYLNIIEKINCAYCSYANNAVAFMREVASRGSLLVSDQACPPGARPAPALSGFCGFRRRQGVPRQAFADEGRREDRGSGVIPTSSSSLPVRNCAPGEDDDGAKTTPPLATRGWLFSARSRTRRGARTGNLHRPPALSAISPARRRHPQW
jgi:hypothetical protein